jgi:hypothetical protein
MCELCAAWLAIPPAIAVVLPRQAVASLEYPITDQNKKRKSRSVRERHRGKLAESAILTM